jgi:plasmid stability protein
MPTITVRNVPPKVVQSLKMLAKRHNRSMEQEVRDLLEGYVVERRAILDQIEAGWQSQTRRPSRRTLLRPPFRFFGGTLVPARPRPGFAATRYAAVAPPSTAITWPVM